MNVSIEPASFRDTDGFIYYKDNQVHRAVFRSYEKAFNMARDSGLHDLLVKTGSLLPHTESEPQISELPSGTDSTGLYKTLSVERIPYISYPYEWCFSQLKDAALLTLDIQLQAMAHGMTLKDASAYNIQFHKGRPVFIDTLSFDIYEEGKPWVAYRQFCTHFLAPLALMCKVHPDLRKLSQVHIDGIPLSVAAPMLPFRTKWQPLLMMHLHLHAKMETKYSGDTTAAGKANAQLSKTKLLAIIQHLRSGISDMALPGHKTEWSDYYAEFSYTDEAIAHKKQLVASWAEKIAPAMAWDLGCNTGLFSELIQPFSNQVVSFDIDHGAIEKFYRRVKEQKHTNILPLVLDLSNPSPAIGWAHSERRSFLQRGPANLVMALALIHHVSIGNNVPFEKVAVMLRELSEWLIIEFVPKSDPQSQRLLVTRADIFNGYTQTNFEDTFGSHFTIEQKQNIQGTERTLYLMKAR